MNYSDFYDSITSDLQRHPRAKTIICHLNSLLVLLMYAAYSALLLMLLVHRDARLLYCIAIPAISFVLLSIIRKLINRPRPYETWTITPMIPKDTRGNSMPSRHIFSSAVIATTWLWIYPPTGIILLFISVIAAAIRVIGGVHYPSDVIVGYLVGVLSGLILFLL